MANGALQMSWQGQTPLDVADENLVDTLEELQKKQNAVSAPFGDCFTHLDEADVSNARACL